MLSYFATDSFSGFFLWLWHLICAHESVCDARHIMGRGSISFAFSFLSLPSVDWLLLCSIFVSERVLGGCLCIE